MGNRFVRPSTTILSLANGETLTVKTYLTHGERSKMRARLYDVVDDKRVFCPERIDTTVVSAYLIDWTITDDRGDRIPIYQESLDAVERILNSLFPEDFDEIYQAIQRHEAAMTLAREQEKKLKAASAASPILLSPFDVVGVSSGSAI